MGFTDFPYALTTQAVYETWDYVRGDGDLIVLHFDGGVPWTEALDGTPYSTDFENDLAFSASQLSIGYVVYVAVTPISATRDGLALYRGDAPNEPLPAPWNAYAFDAPEVVAAFTAYCEDMIDRFDPDYFAYGIEANMLASLEPGKWSAFRTLASEVYLNLKAAHPDLPVFLTFQADAFHASPVSQAAAVDDVLPWTDVIAVSGYPFTAPLEDPALLRSDYFSALAALAPEKPFAVSETAWPAEPVGWPAWYSIDASEESQMRYVERVLEDCDALDARFLVWFFSRDFDEAWDSDFQYLPDAGLIRFWRDTGLYTGDGAARQGLGLWLLNLGRPLRRDVKPGDRRGPYCPFGMPNDMPWIPKGTGVSVISDFASVPYAVRTISMSSEVVLTMP
jgi:hypothetical protein